MNRQLITIFLLFSVISLFAENITVPSGKTTITSYSNATVTVSNGADLHITSATAPLTNSTVTLATENSWLFFDNIHPSAVISNYLSSVKIGTANAANGTNCRVEVYIGGTVVIPHASSIAPLQVFASQNFAGTAGQYGVNYHKSLGAMDNKIRSFKLKRGYMATLATLASGLGYSRVFIADDADLEVAVLQPELDQTVSFIRVTKWYYPSKKGWCSSGSGWANEIDLTASTWYYSWSADKDTRPNQEYVPIKQNTGWPSTSSISNKTNVNHLLGLNEPDRSDQANATVAQAIATMPDLLATGLRIGSPAIADNVTWLYNFMDECKRLNYRVDFVAIHAYWGGSGGAFNAYTNGEVDINKWYNRLKEIHTRTGRPLWITEWNNGANWTNETWPANVAAQEAKQLADLQKIINMMDTCSFVERYSIYNWVENKRALVKGTDSGGNITAGGVTNQFLTPAGEFYRDNYSAMAFNRTKEVIPALSLPDPAISSFLLKSNNTELQISIASSDYNEISASYITEEKIGNGEWHEIDSVFNNQPVLTKFSFPVDLRQGGQYFYRIRSINRAGGVSNPSNEITFAITPGRNIQTGKLQLNTSDWVSLYFGQMYEANPIAILGTPTNKNVGVSMSNRIRNLNTSSLSLRFYPWAYNTSSVYTPDEQPYLVLPAGQYDFGGVKAIVASESAVKDTWKTVTFPNGYFDAAPVIIPTQTSNLSPFATSVHLRNVTKNGFEIQLRRENAKNSSISNETLHYIAISEGSGIMQGRKIRTGFANNIGAHSILNSVTFDFGETIENPLIFAHKQTANNDTLASNLRIISYTGSNCKIYNQIEQSGNNASLSLSAVAKEDAGWLVIGEEPSTSSIEPLRATTCCVYPNPVSGTLYFDNSTNKEMTVKIINLQGVTVKSETGRVSQINVDNLLPGMYFVSINGKMQGIVKK
ncbi:MAG: T9SS type A sorting domain-containing protein [Dysgonamonadaceae bacterium]|jgi:hypothetical protein|nr:T9SS type A sorting domain-containing protein [Dysgonamonadaceae bacterium]